MAGYDATVKILPHSGFLDLRGNAVVRQICSDVLGLSLPAAANQLKTATDGRIVYCISNDHWILQIVDGRQNDVLRTLEQAAVGLSHSFVDVSDMYIQIRLSGPESQEVLSQAVSIDIHPRVFPPGATARAGFAETTAQLHCVDDAPTFIVTVYSSYRQYAIDLLNTAIGAA